MRDDGVLFLVVAIVLSVAIILASSVLIQTRSEQVGSSQAQYLDIMRAGVDFEDFLQEINGCGNYDSRLAAYAQVSLARGFQLSYSGANAAKDLQLTNDNQVLTWEDYDLTAGGCP